MVIDKDINGMPDIILTIYIEKAFDSKFTRLLVKTLQPSNLI